MTAPPPEQGRAACATCGLPYNDKAHVPGQATSPGYHPFAVGPPEEERLAGEIATKILDLDCMRDREDFGNPEWKLGNTCGLVGLIADGLRSYALSQVRAAVERAEEAEAALAEAQQWIDSEPDWKQQFLAMQQAREIDADHDWALWREKWTATIDTYDSLRTKDQALAAESARAQVREELEGLVRRFESSPLDPREKIGQLWHYVHHRLRVLLGAQKEP